MQARSSGGAADASLVYLMCFIDLRGTYLIHTTKHLKMVQSRFVQNPCSHCSMIPLVPHYEYAASVREQATRTVPLLLQIQTSARTLTLSSTPSRATTTTNHKEGKLSMPTARCCRRMHQLLMSHHRATRSFRVSNVDGV